MHLRQQAAIRKESLSMVCRCATRCFLILTLRLIEWSDGRVSPRKCVWCL